ncbi:MAG: hypothetical protein ACRDY3_12420 [Acidimicrobiales bacterium]
MLLVPLDVWDMAKLSLPVATEMAELLDTHIHLLGAVDRQHDVTATDRRLAIVQMDRPAGADSVVETLAATAIDEARR